jgi:NADH:ubiquinone oxidoreductase subunit E
LWMQVAVCAATSCSLRGLQHQLQSTWTFDPQIF